MARAKEQLGDTLVVSTVAGASPKTFPLAPLPQNVSYDTISLQPPAEPNQPVSARISFHGGSAFDYYDEETGGCLVNTGILTNERNVLRAPVKVNTTTLEGVATSGATSPLQYFFEESAPGGTPTYVASGTGKAESASTITISNLAVTNQTNRLLVLMVASDTTAIVDGWDNPPTFNNDPLEYWGSGSATGRHVSCWFRRNPDVTTGDVAITLVASGDAVAIASCYYNVDLVHPLGAFTTAKNEDGDDDTPTVDVPCKMEAEEVVDIVCAGNTSAGAGTNQTDMGNDAAGAAIRGASSRETATADSVTMSWLLGGNSVWLIGGVPIRGTPNPVLYANSADDGAVYVHKFSLGDANFGTLLNTKAWSGVTTKPQGRPAYWTSSGSSYWRQPLGDNIPIDSLTEVASGTSADTWSGVSDAYACHLLVVKDQLYRTIGANGVSILDNDQNPETDGNWPATPFNVGDASARITDIAQVAGLTAITREDGLFEFDGVADAANILPELGKAERNGQGLSFGRGGYFVPGVSSLYWTRTGQPIGPDSPSDRHTANDPSVAVGAYFKHGRWNGTYSYNGHFYGIYVNSLGTSAHIVWAYPAGEGWRWQVIADVTADFNDFHGIYVAETSKFSASEVRPCLFFANGNDLSFLWLDKNGSPMLRRGDIDLHTSATVTSGRIDFGLPGVNKQLTFIDGWAEDMVANINHHKFRIRVYRDGGTVEDVGTPITGDGISPDGYFTKHWTQDTNDECRSLLFEAWWIGVNSLTDQNGPLLRDIQLHAIAKPTSTRQWGFLISAEDDSFMTATTIETDLTAYQNDLMKFKLPYRDAFNGMLVGLTLLPPDEVQRLTPRGQEPRRYTFRATVREMPSS